MRQMRVLVAFVVMGVFAPTLVHAQGAPGPGDNSKIWIGGDLGLSPLGKLKASAFDLSESVDAAAAFGIAGRLEFRASPIISIGFAPGLILNVKGEDGSDSGTELDLPLRLAVGGEVAPKVRLYGFVAPGYSILFPPSDSQGNTVHFSGFMVGFGGGAGFRIAPRFMLTGELGYQFRFLSTTQQGIDVSLQVNYLTFSVGAVVAID